jgi:hypothetical protein
MLLADMVTTIWHIHRKVLPFTGKHLVGHCDLSSPSHGACGSGIVASGHHPVAVAAVLGSC